MDKDFLWQVGEYIANNHTISEASLHFHKSPSSIKKYLAKIRDQESSFYNEILAEKIKLAQAKIELEGQRKGGATGKRGRYLNEEQARMYLEVFLSSGLNLSDFAELSRIPKSTLYDTFNSISDKELWEQFRKLMMRHQNYQNIDGVHEIEESKWKR